MNKDDTVKSQTPLTNREKEKLLEDFLMDIDCLDDLDRWADRLNFFDIISISGMEIRHSNFLAWLLDPDSPHGLGTYFIRKLLLGAAKIYGPEKTPISIVDIDGLDLSDLMVRREEASIDILAISERSKMVLAIENKIHSQEQNGQLIRYHKYIDETYPNHKKFLIYLTLEGKVPSDDEWYPLSHEYIRRLVDSILENRDLSDRCRIYLEDYSNTLAGELMNDEELKQTCLKIYNNHKRAIDLIIENLPDQHSEIFDACKKMLEDYEKQGKVKNLTSTNAYLRFTTPRIRAKVGQFGYDNWVSEKDLLVFEIDLTKSSGRYMSLIIGPGKTEYRTAWYDYLKGTKLSNNPRKSLTDSWTSIQILHIKKKPSSENYVEEYIRKVSEYLKGLSEIEDIIEAGPDITE